MKEFNEVLAELSNVSNAVLTPHLNCTNSDKQKQRKFRKSNKIDALPEVSERDKEIRRLWCIRQYNVIANMPSTAVLVA